MAAQGSRAKRLIKVAVKAAVRTAGGLAPRRGGDSRILTYHSVGSREHEMNVSVEAFRAQMAWLAEHCRPIPLAEAAQAAPGVAVTFDDGYRDNLTHAAPVLHEFGIPATVFVVAGRMGGMLDHDHDPATSSLLTWDEARELASAGVEIGAHSMSHRRLAHLDPAEQRDEIAESARLIERHLGAPPASFAYPFGAATDYTETTVRLVRECGFTCAVSNRYGTNRAGADAWTLRRIWIDATDSPASFRAKVDGRLDWLAALDSAWGVAARRRLNRLLRTG
ncbi:MAG: polysaccharide deacetylase family protein [Candidatus Hydrogenedentes bacterium]|nr:polysaccharide deacetylase family protein [Candidatus Hydrogenedentota bacterium]